MKISYRKKSTEKIRVSEKTDAEFINNSVFSICDRLKKDTVFYKCGLLLLSGNSGNLEKELQDIDVLAGFIDSCILKNDIKKALLYTVLLKKKVSEFIENVNSSEIVLPVSN